eukprot:TRINITY_DN13705_c0_g1_i2.p1 TRINITY_DN13705_c0_g1~~TRINITY_DN13705_c0_g1_i2.p1  ORF type:complete len:102 (+),score=9.08 TRINITY_DN13705_c0_g1_i2:89-394(+)
MCIRDRSTLTHACPRLGCEGSGAPTSTLTPASISVPPNFSLAEPEVWLRMPDSSLSGRASNRRRPSGRQSAATEEAVSYTHLTLPTKRIVMISVVAASFKK